MVRAAADRQGLSSVSVPLGAHVATANGVWRAATRSACAGPSIHRSPPKLAAQRALSLAVFCADRLGLLQLRAPNEKQGKARCATHGGKRHGAMRRSCGQVYLLPQIVHVAPLLRLDLHTVSVVR